MLPKGTLDSVFAAWTRLGIGFTVAPKDQEPDLEVLILETAVASTAASRLFTYPVEWLVAHGDVVDFARLVNLIRTRKDYRQYQPEVAVFCSEILRLGGNPEFMTAMRSCAKAPDARPFLETARRSAALAQVEYQAATTESRWYGRWMTPVGIKKNPGVFQDDEWIWGNNPRLAQRHHHVTTA